MHYYQHNIGDYARDTGHLSVLEHGIYRLILDWCYLNEKPITTEQAMRVGRGNPTETQSVLSEFFSQNSDGWEHKRVNAEIDAFHSKSKRNRENGAKGGRPKPTNNPVGSQSDAKHNPNQEPITNNQEPIREDTFSDEMCGAAFAAPAPVPETVIPQQQPNPTPAKPKSDEPKAARLPADWRLPKAWGDWALAEFPHWTPEAVRIEADKFSDHWATKTGKDARKADWLATWRNWCRSDIAQRSHQPMRAVRPARPGQMTAEDRAEWERAEDEKAKRLLFGDVIDAQALEIDHAPN